MNTQKMQLKDMVLSLGVGKFYLLGLVRPEQPLLPIKR